MDTEEPVPKAFGFNISTKLFLRELADDGWPALESLISYVWKGAQACRRSQYEGLANLGVRWSLNQRSSTMIEDFRLNYR